MFQLTKNEVVELSRSQIVSLNSGRGSNIKYPPFAFIELGVAMLSSVLNSEYAITVNKNIMRAFVALRQYVLNYAELKHDMLFFAFKKLFFDCKYFQKKMYFRALFPRKVSY